MEILSEKIAEVLERLTSRINELESRVAALEQRPAPAANLASRPAAAAQAGALHPVRQLADARNGGVMPAIGKIFLGIAGAYVLRAIAESGLLPRTAVVPIALAYAFTWLVFAARAAGGGARFAGTAYGISSALILAPMLWELTVKFGVLSCWVTAAVLVGFVVSASALAWKRNLLSVVWVSTLAAAITAISLFVVTRDPVPFTLALLAMAVVAETAACRDHWFSLRPLVAFTADMAILALMAVYTRAEGPSPDYKPVSAVVLLALSIALFAVYGLSTLLRTITLGRLIRPFEAAQTVIAFFLAAVGILRVTHNAAAPVVGAFCLAASAACYWAAHLRFNRRLQARNYHVFAAWAATLLVAGSLLSLSVGLLTVWLSLVAVVMAAATARYGLLVPGFHGLVYLAAAAGASGFLAYAAQVLTATVPALPPAPLWIAAFAVFLCQSIAFRIKGENWRARALRLGYAALAIYAGTAVLVLAIARIALHERASASSLAIVRTLVICVAALALGFTGSRWKRPELVWLGYTAMGFCTLKLLVEDFRSGTAGSVAISLFLYGMVWVLLPRVARSGVRTAESSARAA